jgi:hypothetical protein
MRPALSLLLLGPAVLLIPVQAWAQEAAPQVQGVDDPIAAVLQADDAGNAGAGPGGADGALAGGNQPLAGGTDPVAAPDDTFVGGVRPPDDGPDVVGAINNQPLGNAPPRRQRRRPPDDDAYAPLGVKAGSFLVRPTLDVSAGYNTNPAAAAGNQKGSAFGRVNGEVLVESDWSRHALTGGARGTYTYFMRNHDDNQLDFDANALGRMDISATTNATLGVRGAVTSERIGDPNLPAGVVDRPLIASYGATLGGNWKPNRLGVTLEGDVGRQTYENAKLGSGVTVNNSDRDYSAYELRLRTGYDVSDKLTPFVEVSTNTRQHDESIDRNGIARDSNGVSASLGARYNLTNLIELNASVGYRVQKYDDPTLPDLSGLLANGSLAWEATGLTTVTLTAATAFEETTLIGSSGSVNNTVGVNIEHRLRRNVILNAGMTFERADFSGVDRSDDTLRFEAGMEWRFNRSMALRANVAHERLMSSVGADDYNATLVQVGMRFRR